MGILLQKGIFVGFRYAYFGQLLMLFGTMRYAMYRAVTFIRESDNGCFRPLIGATIKV